MSVYLDASVLIALFTTDLFTDRAEALLRSVRTILIVSDFAAGWIRPSVRRTRSPVPSPSSAPKR